MEGLERGLPKLMKGMKKKEEPLAKKIGLWLIATHERCTSVLQL